jgi:hypothetical protein
MESKDEFESRRFERPLKAKAQGVSLYGFDRFEQVKNGKR